MNEPRRYRIHEVLGKGSFGLVYRAELLGSGGFSKPVALKVLRGTFDPAAEIEQRLRDEARLLGMLRHPNVVQVDGLARLPDGWAVVMEYIQGIDVGVLIRIGPLPPRAALEITREVAGALHAAWALPSPLTEQPLKLVHRDLKPGNLRITAHGEVKILDFGAARAETGSREANTQAWRFGTPRYMAPERHDGVEGPAGDIYALGIVLAQMLTGEKAADPPTNADRHRGFSEGVVHGVSERLGQELIARTERCGPEIAQLITDMIAYEPDQRPTAREVQQRLRALVDQVGGLDLRSWAEAEIPRLLALQPPLARDERCGEIIEESRGEPTLAPPRPPPPRPMVPLTDPGPADTMPIRPRWHLAARGVALGLIVFAVGMLALRGTLGRWPWELPRRATPELGANMALPTVADPGPRSGSVAPSGDAGATPDGSPQGPAEDDDAIEFAPATVVIDKAAGASGARHAASTPASASPAAATAPSEAAPAATPAPAPAAPAPAPASTASTPETGKEATEAGFGAARYSVDGAVVEAWAEGGGQRYRPGSLPPGTYTLSVRFSADQEPVPAGTFTVAAGESARLTCNASMLRCRRTS